MRCDVGAPSAERLLVGDAQRIILLGDGGFGVVAARALRSLVEEVCIRGTAVGDTVATPDDGIGGALSTRRSRWCR